MRTTLFALATLVAAASAQVPAYYETTLSGTNGAYKVFASTDRAFMPEKIVFSGAYPTNGTFYVERVSDGIYELIAQGNVTNGVLSATNSVVVHPGDTLYYNRSGAGTVTSAVIQAHGQLYRRFP